MTRMDTFKVGDRVQRRHRSDLMVGVVVKVANNLFKDTAMSTQRVRVRWPTGSVGSHSGAQLQLAWPEFFGGG